jgi:hypothetical protein
VLNLISIFSRLPEKEGARGSRRPWFWLARNARSVTDMGAPFSLSVHGLCLCRFASRLPMPCRPCQIINVLLVRMDDHCTIPSDHPARKRARYVLVSSWEPVTLQGRNSGLESRRLIVRTSTHWFILWQDIWFCKLWIQTTHYVILCHFRAMRLLHSPRSPPGLGQFFRVDSFNISNQMRVVPPSAPIPISSYLQSLPIMESHWDW